MEASDCIFNDTIEAVRRQEGCIRLCYVPEGSKTPHCFHCQPELEISRQISEAGGQQHLSKVVRDAIREKVLGWLIPSFTSTQYGHHAYGQLSQTCPLAIRIGADDGSEMGVFYGLKQPQREANLRTALDEYLRFGLEAGIIYVT